MSSYGILSWQRSARVLVLGIGVAAGSAGLLTLRPLPAALDGAVYSVTALQLQVLHDHRGPWMGRTVLVRGVVKGFLPPVPHGVLPPERIWMNLALLDPDKGPGILGNLPLIRGTENPVLHRLRLAPLIGPLMPPPPALDWEAVAIYRVTLHPLPNTSCDLCFMAEVRDAV